MHTSVTLFAAHVIHEHPSGLAFVAQLSHDSFDASAVAGRAITRKTARVRHLDARCLTLTLLTAGISEFPMIGQTLITLLASNARFARALARPLIALTRGRSYWVTIAFMTSLTFAEAPHVFTTRSAVVTLDVLVARAVARLDITCGTTAAVAFASLAVFQSDRVSVVPVGAFFAARARRVIQTLEASACALIASSTVGQVNVVVALTWQTFAAGTRRVAIETGRTSLTKLPTITGHTLTRVDLSGVAKQKVMKSINWKHFFEFLSENILRLIANIFN